MEQIKVKLNVHRAFYRGLELGAPRLFGPEGGYTEYVKEGFTLLREIEMFQIGYDLAYNDDAYFYAWKDNKNLLYMAVRNGDIKPVDWYFKEGINGIFVEQKSGLK